jgi:hypothetical protein
MKGHLEIFEHRLKAVAKKLPGVDQGQEDTLFAAFEQALGSDDIPFYDVKCGSTLADYYQSQFVKFVKKSTAK